MRIAYYAPMKPPTHPTPSGDRRMGRLLMRALGEAGHAVELASEFRSYDGKGEDTVQHALRDQGLAEADTLAAAWQRAAPADRPQLWFTYHLYHKAPDWLGPRVSRTLAIPYVVAEASHAPKRAGGAWDLGYRAAAEAIGAADIVYAMTRLDSACLKPLVPPGHRLCCLPPFIDDTDLVAPDRAKLSHRFDLDMKRHWLLSVAMMRPGDKLASYRELAAALALLQGEDWQLLLVGDGPCRSEVEALFAPQADRVRFAGALEPEALAMLYAAAALYLWPGVGEAYGMAYLEAQSQATPVIATDRRGIPDVVQPGAGGLLLPPENAAAYAGAIRALLDDDSLRSRMGHAARDFVCSERSLAATVDRLAETLP